MQSTSSSIRTRAAESICYDNNHYTEGTSASIKQQKVPSIYKGQVVT